MLREAGFAGLLPDDVARSVRARITNYAGYYDAMFFYLFSGWDKTDGDRATAKGAVETLVIDAGLETGYKADGTDDGAPPAGGTGQVSADTRPYDSRPVTPSFEGDAYTGASTGIVVTGARDADGDAVLYRLAAPATGEGGNDNNLVTLAIVDGKLTIVFREGGPDWEAANAGGKKAANSGSYVFVVEALSESDLSSETGDRSARDGRKTASVSFEYVIEDADEAPWSVEFDSDNTDDTELTTITGIGRDDGETEILTALNDAKDGANTTFAVLWARLAGKGLIVGAGETRPDEAALASFDIKTLLRVMTDEGATTNPRLKWDTELVGLGGGTIWYRDPADDVVKSHIFGLGDAVDVGIRASDPASDPASDESDGADDAPQSGPEAPAAGTLVQVIDRIGSLESQIAAAEAALPGQIAAALAQVPEDQKAQVEATARQAAQQLIDGLKAFLATAQEQRTELEAAQAVPESGPASGGRLFSDHVLTIVNGSIHVVPRPGVKSYSGSELLAENTDGSGSAVEVGTLASDDDDHTSFWLVQGTGFEIDDTTLNYAGTAAQAGSFETLPDGKVHTLLLISGAADAVTAVGAAGTSGQMFVDADGDDGTTPATFAYDASIMGSNTPAVTTDTALDTDEADGGTAANSSLTYSIMLSGGNVYHSAGGTVGERQALTKGGALGSALITDLFEIKTPIIPDTDGEHVYVLVVRVVNGSGADSNGSPRFMTAVDWAAATKADFVLLGTLTVTVSGANTENAAHEASWVANTGTAVENGQLYALADGTSRDDIKIESFDVRLSDVNEAPKTQTEDGFAAPERPEATTDGSDAEDNDVTGDVTAASHATGAREVETVGGALSSTQAGTLLLSVGIMAAHDEDGDRPDRPIASDNSDENVRYMVTGYEEADYHQTIGDRVEEHQGWLERWVANESGDGGTWVRLDPKVAATGFTGRQLIDRDGVTGNENDGTDVYAIDADVVTHADGVLAVANNATTKVGTVTVTIGAGITVYHGEGGTSTFTVDAGAAALDT